MSMTSTLKREWSALKRGRPGHRFQTRFESAKKARKTADLAHQAGRLVRLVMALAMIAIGVVLVFIPGPAILFFFVGGGLLASESRLIARFLDWSEVRGRALWNWSKRHWKALPGWGKVVVPVTAMCFVLAGSFFVLRLVI